MHTTATAWLKRCTTLALGALLLSAVPGASLGAPEEPAGVALQMHVRIPLRDGTYLNATLFRPVGATKPAPVVFMLTPYPADASHPSANYFTKHGFIYAYVDVRGRGDSPGDFTPLEHEALDGYDVVEWLGSQPWSDGHVGMFGGSYAGGDQWQVAAQHPPHLATIAPVASVRAGVDWPMSNNMPGTYNVQWLTFTTGHTLYTSLFQDSALWQGAFERFYLSGKAFSQLDVEAGNPLPIFHTWLQHPEFDDYWRKLALTPDQVAGVKLPMLVITGARDGDQPGTLSFYRDHLNADGSQPANYFLVVGPWDHPGTREPKADFGGEHHAAASVIDVLRLHLEWYRHVFFNEPTPAFLQKNVAYYVSGPGADCWKYADSLAGATKGTRTLYLNGRGGADSLYRSGDLQDAPAGATGASWVSDPADLSHAKAVPAPPGDALHGDGLVFHSAPFDRDTEITGQVQIKLSLAIDGPDADIGYDLYLITPDGKAHNLSGDAIRARYRQSLERAVAVKPGETNSYDLGKGLWFSVRAPKGSRLRLVLQSVNDVWSEKNWNASKPVAEQTAADAHRETIRLIQTKEHPSTITLPLGDEAAACKASAAW